MTHEQEMLARAINHIDVDMILAAHGPRKKLRRVIPVAVAVCLIAALAVAFPYLREIIDTNSDILSSGEGVGDEGNPSASAEDLPVTGQNLPVTLGGTTLTLKAVTDTTATFELVKTDDTPVYAMLYDLRGGVLASTEPDFKDNGVTIRPNTIRIYVNGTEQPTYRLPSAPGSYTVAVDFTSVRNGQYPMKEIMGLYAYIGEDGKAVTERFSLKQESVPPAA